MKKLNCWEFMKCGREAGGEHAYDQGVCPSFAEERLDGVHDGSNAGRACWVVTGTLCKGEVQGTFARKFKNCSTCGFYEQVKKEEFPNFKLSAVLLRNLG